MLWLLTGGRLAIHKHVYWAKGGMSFVELTREEVKLITENTSHVVTKD